MLPTLLSRIGVPLLANILVDAVQKINHPAAAGVSGAIADLEKEIISGGVTQAELDRANRAAEISAETRAREAGLLVEINKTIQTETTSTDIYVRRMRPTFGYLMAIAWFFQMAAIAYLMVFETEKLPLLIGSLDSLGVIWTMALSVLGLYLFQRTGGNPNVNSGAGLIPFLPVKRKGTAVEEDKPAAEPVPKPSQPAARAADRFNS